MGSNSGWEVSLGRIQAQGERYCPGGDGEGHERPRETPVPPEAQVVRREDKTSRKPLPRFSAASEFDRFVETHDLASYWDEFEEADRLELKPELATRIGRRAHRKKLISLRLDEWQLRAAKAIAARRKIPYHAVLR